MDFAWTKLQDELYQGLLRLVQDNLGPDKQTRGELWTRKQWEICGNLGLLGLSVPEAYGGKGYDALTTALALEAFGYGCEDMGLAFSVCAHLLACVMPIVEYGSEEMKNRLLPGLCSGELIGANAITEKEAGSDIFALQTHAMRDADMYILTGTKSYVSNGPVADIFVVYASTNPQHGYLGITGFVIEKNTRGLVLSDQFDKMGLISTPACQVTLDECRVPITNRLGREGQGSSVFRKSMQWERACLFAIYVGQMERQLEQTIAYACERHQFGKAIGKNQAIAHRLADMKLRLESARLLLYRACWLLDQKKASMLDIALSKLAISEAAVQGGLDALQIHGSPGFDRECGIEGMLRDAIPSTIFSGTSEMLRDIIASELGL